MSWMLIAGGIAFLVIGDRLMENGLLHLIGKSMQQSLMAAILSLICRGAAPFMMLSAICSLQNQFGFLFSVLAGTGIFGAIFVFSTIGTIKSFSGNRRVVTRECAALAVFLLFLMIVGRGTWQEAHPDAILGRGTGILLLILFAGECVCLMGESMKGYNIPEEKDPWPRFLSLCIAGIGFCILGLGAFLTVNGVEILSDTEQIYPMFPGLLLGIAAAYGMYGHAAWKQIGKKGAKVLPAIWGPASLGIIGSLAVSCLVQPVVLSYPAVLLFAMSIPVLGVSMLSMLIGKRIGRIQGVFVFCVNTVVVIFAASKLIGGVF